jgi:hypothetical protein
VRRLTAIVALSMTVLLGLVGSSQAATCAEFSNQAAAQAAANTRDQDGDGIYCETLPCPCATPGAPASPSTTATPPAPTPAPEPAPAPPPVVEPTPPPAEQGRDPQPAPTPSPTDSESCTRTDRVVRVGISRTKYPAVLRHIRQAVRAGWPRVLTINRAGADERRDRALRDIPTKERYDRDEWPMAFARKTWRTHVAYVSSGQNRGAGASIGLKLRRYCDGVRFRVVGY